MKVKVFLVFALFSYCCAAQTEEEKRNANGRANIPDIGRIGLKCVKNFLKNGFPIVGIPTFDPLHISKYHFKLDSDHLRGDVTVKDLTLREFSDIEVSTTNNQHECFVDQTAPTMLKKSPLNATDAKEWKTARKTQKLHNTIAVKINAETEYDMDLMLMGFVPITGVGHIDADLKLFLTTGLTDEGKGNAVKITEFKACLDVDKDMLFGVTGLQGNEKLSSIIAKQLREVIVQGLNEEYKEGLSNKLTAIQAVLNKVFGNGMLNMFMLPLLDELCGKDEPPQTDN